MREEFFTKVDSPPNKDSKKQCKRRASHQGGLQPLAACADQGKYLSRSEGAVGKLNWQKSSRSPGEIPVIKPNVGSRRQCKVARDAKNSQTKYFNLSKTPEGKDARSALASWRVCTRLSGLPIDLINPVIWENFLGIRSFAGHFFFAPALWLCDSKKGWGWPLMVDT